MRKHRPTRWHRGLATAVVLVAAAALVGAGHTLGTDAAFSTFTVVNGNVAGAGVWADDEPPVVEEEAQPDGNLTATQSSLTTANGPSATQQSPSPTTTSSGTTTTTTAPSQASERQSSATTTTTTTTTSTPEPPSSTVPSEADSGDVGDGDADAVANKTNSESAS